MVVVLRGLRKQGAPHKYRPQVISRLGPQEGGPNFGNPHFLLLWALTFWGSGLGFCGGSGVVGFGASEIWGFLGSGDWGSGRVLGFWGSGLGIY